MEEIWQPIENYEGLYSISNLSQVKNRHGRIVKAFKNADGYMDVKLSVEKAEFEELGAPYPDYVVEVRSGISELERLRDMMDSAFPHLDVNAGV